MSRHFNVLINVLKNMNKDYSNLEEKKSKFLNALSPKWKFKVVADEARP